MEKKNNGEKFLKVAFAGIVIPFMIVFILVTMPFYLLGLFFNWIFNLELL
jgi:hypothetical protein